MFPPCTPFFWVLECQTGRRSRPFLRRRGGLSQREPALGWPSRRGVRAGLRSATGNRVPAETWVAGSNPALSVPRGGTDGSPTSPLLEVLRETVRLSRPSSRTTRGPASLGRPSRPQLPALRG